MNATADQKRGDQTVEERTAQGRPQMPAGYGLLPASEGRGLLPWDWVTERLEQARNYWICTTRPDGRPHAAPVWGVWVDDAVYFGSDPKSRKGKNLAANPAVTVHLESGDEVVILEGVAESVTRPEAALWQRIAEGYAAKYDGFTPEAPTEEGMYVVRPQVVLAWIESDFPGSATKWILNG